MNNYYSDECEVAIVSGMPEGIGETRCLLAHKSLKLQDFTACFDIGQIPRTSLFWVSQV